MAKYVKYEELLHKVDHLRNKREKDGHPVLAKSLDIVITLIRRAPSVDLVHCGECEFAYPCRAGLMCLHDKGLVGTCREDDFCSYGEHSINRKDK